MRRPRPLTGAALAAFTVAAAVTGLGTGPSASADTGSAGDLYVNGSSACSDNGTGTQAEPFCTVQAAADVVEPGQTVLVDGSASFGPVTVTRSGTPAQPITFERGPGTTAGFALAGSAGQAVVTFRNVHDVTFRGAGIGRLTDAVDVVGSQNITLDQLDIANAAGYTDGDDIRIDGVSSGVTVSRSRLGYTTPEGHAVDVSAGARDITVTTNLIPGTNQSSVAMNGTTGAAITSNSMDDNCEPEVSLTGGTTGTVENNVLASSNAAPSATCPDEAVVSVDAASAPGVTSDYNDFDASATHRAAYSWAGTDYATPSDRTTATGDGTHDGDTSSFVLPWGAIDPSGIDAANADAPGELPTDYNGNPRRDDPLVANTGTGDVGYADRGAYEQHDSITVPADEAATPALSTVPFTASVPADDATSSWGEPLTYSVDFGDGSAPVTGTASTPPQHTYTVPGAYTETVTATDTDGLTQTRSTQVVAATDTLAPAALSSRTGQGDAGAIGGEGVFAVSTTDEFEMASQTIDFGDGTTGSVSNGQATHEYTKPGTYTATLTRTDVLGRVSTAEASFTATDGTWQQSGSQWNTATIPAHGTYVFEGSYLGSMSADPVVLRVNVTGAKDGGWLTAYTAYGTRPSASTLNFPAGHGASNQESVIPSASGSISLYNGAASPVTVAVKEVASFQPDDNGDSYHPTSPTTLLDSRYGTGGVTGPVGAGTSLTVQVAGKNGVPATATAVTLDVAENTTKATGSLTVAPDGNPEWGVTASYWAAGESVTNLVTVPLTDGKVTLTSNSTGGANLIAALAGWYSSDTTGSGAWPVTPVRVLNTQTGLGEPGGKALKLAAHATLKVKVAGTAGLPATGLTATDLNLTVSAPTASGWLVASPDGTTRPTAGALNYTKGHTIAGQALIKVGTDGYVDLYNPTSSAINVFADIHGAYLQMPSATG